MKRNVLAVAAFVLSASAALAGSTIDPSQPADSSKLASAPVRGNFNAAYTDINNLLTSFPGTNAPINPSVGQLWRQTNVSPQIVWQWSGGAWLRYSTFDTAGGKVTPAFGNSLLAWQQLLTGTGGLGTSGQCLVSTGNSTVPQAQNCLSAVAVQATAPVAFDPSGVTFSLNYGPAFALSGSSLDLADVITAASNVGSASAVPVLTFNSKGRLTTVSTTPITPAAIGAVPTSRAITAGTGLTGGCATLGSDCSLALANVLTAGGPTGNGQNVPVITYNSFGQITAVSTATIAPPASAVTGQFSLLQFPNIANASVLGNVSGSSSTPAALNSAQITSLINPATSSLSGALPAWPNDVTKYFRGDGSYQTLNFAAISGTNTVAQGGTGAASLSSGLPLFGNGTSPITAGSLSGNTTQLATVSGSLTPGNCLTSDASHNIIDLGATCGGGGGGGSPGGSNGQVQYNNAGAFGGIASSTPGYALISNTSGVAPSFQGFLQSGTGAATRVWQDKVGDWLNAKDFGVKCDGSTNDVSAVNAAIVQANAVAGGSSAQAVGVQMPAGTCIVGSSSITMKSNVYLRGAGRGATILKLLASNTSPVIIGQSLQNISITGFTIDLNGFASTNNGTAISMLAINYLRIEGNEVKNMGAIGIGVDSSTNWWVQKNTVTKSAPDYTIFNVAYVLSCSVSASVNGHFTDNVGINAASDFCAAAPEIARNYFTGWGAGSGIVTEQDPKSYGAIIKDNVLVNGGQQPDYIGFHGSGIENWARDSVISGNYISGNGGAGIDQGGQRSSVFGNIIKDNSTITAGYSGIACRYGSSTYNCSGSVYSGNQSYNTNGATGPQGYGYSEESASIANVKLVPGNNFSTNASGDMSILSTTTEGVWIPFSPTFAATGGTAVAYSNSNSSYFISGKTLYYRLAWSMTWTAAPSATTWTFPLSGKSSGNNFFVFYCVNTGIQANGFSSNSGTGVAFGAGINSANIFSASANTYVTSGFVQLQ